jgi:hypothetical protein
MNIIVFHFFITSFYVGAYASTICLYLSVSSKSYSIASKCYFSLSNFLAKNLFLLAIALGDKKFGSSFGSTSSKSSSFYFFWCSSLNLDLMTASVRLSKKNAPMNTSGIKYATVNGENACWVMVMVEVHPSSVTEVKMAMKA